MNKICKSLLLFCLCANAFGVEFYVALDGNDSNIGAKDKPFATLLQARDAIRKLKASSSLNEQITVWLRKGEYFLSQSFELLQQDSGEPNSPIVYRAFPNEGVILSGGMKISGKNFHMVDDDSVLAKLPKASRAKVMVIDLKEEGFFNYGHIARYGHMQSVVPAPLELFFNDVPMNLARYPNQGFIKIGKVIDKGSVPRSGDYSERGGIFEYTDERHSRWVNVKDLWLEGTFMYGYADDNIKVAKIDPVSRTVHLSGPHIYGIGSGKDYQQYKAYNLIEELDEPGEWFLDRDCGKLYFWPPSRIDNAHIRVSVLEEPIVVLQNVSYVVLRDITAETGRGIGIYIEGGQNNLVAGCTVRDVGTSGIFMGQGSKQTFPHITHNDYEGIVVSKQIGNLQAHIYKDPTWDRKAGRNHKILSCEVYNTGCGGIYLSGGSKARLEKGNCEVVNCRIRDYNRRNKFLWSGVNIDGCGNRIANCEIYNSNFQGIYVHGNEHMFEYNNIHDVALDSYDTSAWYLGRDPSDRGNVIQYNFFYKVGRDDRMVMGIYCDDATADVNVFGNIFYHVAKGRAVVYSNAGSDLTVRNNIFIDCGSAVEISSMWYAWGKNLIPQFFGDDGTFTRRLTKLLDIKKPPYSTRYPELVDWMDPIPDSNNEYVGMRPARNRMENNVIVKCKCPLTLSGDYAQFDENNNVKTNEESGFVDAKNMNFQLRENSIVYKEIHGFKEIPFEKIGLYVDEYRASLP